MSSKATPRRVILNVRYEDLPAAAKMAQDWHTWYDTPEWDKKKQSFGGKFIVHETKTGTIVINGK